MLVVVLARAVLVVNIRAGVLVQAAAALADAAITVPSSLMLSSSTRHSLMGLPYTRVWPMRLLLSISSECSSSPVWSPAALEYASLSAIAACTSMRMRSTSSVACVLMRVLGEIRVHVLGPRVLVHVRGLEAMLSKFKKPISWSMCACW